MIYLFTLCAWNYYNAPQNTRFRERLNRHISLNLLPENYVLIESTDFTLQQTYSYNVRLFLCNFYRIPNAVISNIAIEAYSTVWHYCSGSLEGGGVQSHADILINSCRFISCTSTSSGGAISNRNGSLTVFRTEFIQCSSSSYGGAIYHNDGSNYFDNFIVSCMFFMCSSSSNTTNTGNAMYIELNTNPAHTISMEFNRYSQSNATESYALVDMTTQANLSSEYYSVFRDIFYDAGEGVWKVPTATFTPSPSASQSLYPTVTETPTPSVSASPSISATPSVSQSPTPSNSAPFPTPTASQSPTLTPLPTMSDLPVPTQTPLPSKTPDPSPTQSATASRSPLPSTPPATPWPTSTPTMSDVPDISWKSLGIGLGIFLTLIIIIGLLVMSIWCCMNLNPVRVFTRQVIGLSPDEVNNYGDEGLCPCC